MAADSHDGLGGGWIPGNGEIAVSGVSWPESVDRRSTVPKRKGRLVFRDSGFGLDTPVHGRAGERDPPGKSASRRHRDPRSKILRLACRNPPRF